MKKFLFLLFMAFPLTMASAHAASEHGGTPMKKKVDEHADTPMK